jgi:hypothetical protein
LGILPVDLLQYVVLLMLLLTVVVLMVVLSLDAFVHFRCQFA